MSINLSADRIWKNPLGRLLIILVGVGVVFGVLTLYPQILPVVEWSIPVTFVLLGLYRLYPFGTKNQITSAAGGLLTLGGITYASYLLIPMGELAGALAQLIPVIGIFVDLIATSYRNQNTDIRT